jgi:hypothetical protein
MIVPVVFAFVIILLSIVPGGALAAAEVEEHQDKVLRGGRRNAGSSFPPPAATTTTTLIDNKNLLENAQQHFHERMLAEMKKTSSEALYNALDGKDVLHIKENFRKLSTRISENDQLASDDTDALVAMIQGWQSSTMETLTDTMDDATAQQIGSIIQAIADFLIFLITLPLNIIGAILAFIGNLLTREPSDELFKAVESGDTDALVAKIQGWTSSTMATFHEAIMEHYPMDDITAQQIDGIIQAIADFLIFLITLPLNIIGAILAFITNILTREPENESINE